MINNGAQAFFDSHAKQRAPAQALDEAFDITTARDRGGYSIWLAKPQDHTTERFGLQQEVLVLYSHYPVTDARVLTAIESVFSDSTYRNRLDRVLVLLVHNGDSTATSELVRTNTDRVIVAFCADELRDQHRGDVFVRARIADRFGSTDLFGMSSPITSDRYFFGRDPLVHELAARALVHGQNSGVFGLRKTGKTSVLFALRRQIAGDAVKVAYLDCQSPGVHAGRWWQVLELIAARLLGRELDPPYGPDDAAPRFAKDVNSLLDTGESRAVVMLDEVEYITVGISGALGSHWDSDFVPLWQTIRAAHQESEARLTFIVAGVNPASVERPHFGSVPNPIFQLAVPQYLEPLNVDSVRRMVRTIGRYTGLAFDEPVYEYLKTSYGGHPYLIRVACSELWHAADTTSPIQRHQVSAGDFAKHQGEIKGRLAHPIKDILLSLVWWYPEEYDLLQILASGDTPFVDEYLAARPDSFVQFARYGILKEGTAEFAIADVREFLRDSGDTYKKELSPFRRGDIPAELLPEVPDLDVLSDLFQRRSQIELLLRRAIVLYLGMHCNWDNRRLSQSIGQEVKVRSDRPRPMDLFVGRQPQDAINDLYSPDLKSVVVGNWAVFAPLFDNSKQRFEMNMDTLNLARRIDTHTKPVGQADLENFRNSYGWLLAHLNKVPQS